MHMAPHAEGCGAAAPSAPATHFRPCVTTDIRLRSITTLFFSLPENLHLSSVGDAQLNN
jgi:hypothetical protein